MNCRRPKAGPRPATSRHGSVGMAGRFPVLRATLRCSSARPRAATPPLELVSGGKREVFLRITMGKWIIYVSST